MTLPVNKVRPDLIKCQRVDRPHFVLDYRTAATFAAGCVVRATPA